MEISNFTSRIEEISNTASRKELMESIQAIEKEAYRFLQLENSEKWAPGRGLQISKLLTEMKDAIIKKILDYIGGIPSGLTLAAVGGYGRGELSPHSDIDLLILHEERADVKKFAQNFLYILWDMNYHLGSSTRTVENMIEHAYKDETFLTAVFEARYLAGERKLYDKIKIALVKILKRTKVDYLKTKIDEIYNIIDNSGNEVLLKEPNLKNNAGGLRSVHLMEWLNSAFYLENGLQGLRKILPPILFKKVYISYDFILYIRNYLHFVRGRKEDVLTMEYHMDVADKLKISGEDRQKMRKLMKHYYDRASDILLALLYVCEEFSVRFIKTGWGGLFPRKKQETDYFVLDKRFFLKENLEPSVNVAFDMLLECFRNNYRYSYSLIRYLKQSSFLIQDNDRTSPAVFKKFRSVLELPNSYQALKVMKLSGFLYRYIPVLGRVRHQIIYNPFHNFTVDQHSIEAVGALEGLFSMQPERNDIPKYASLIETAERYQATAWILKFSLLLHDVGKAYAGEHTKNGVEMASGYLSTLPLYSSYKTAMLFLIQNHLLLSNVARRSDLGSMQTLLDLSREIFLSPYPQEYLDFLYLETYADITATNPKNFSGYLANLLTQLYRKTSGLLSQEFGPDYHQKIIRQSLDKVKEASGAEESVVEEYFKDMGERYAVTNSPDEISADFQTATALHVNDYKLDVKLYNDYFKIKIFAPDRHGLFASLSGILLLAGADIVRANIHTFKGIAIDEFYITRIFGLELEEQSMKEQHQHWKDDLDKLYRDNIDLPEKLDSRIRNYKKNIRPVHDVFRRNTEVTFLEDNHTGILLDISCTDRPALLYDITSFLSHYGFEILEAVIDTTGWYVRDRFSLKGRALSEEETGDLRGELIKLIDKWSN